MAISLFVIQVIFSLLSNQASILVASIKLNSQHLGMGGFETPLDWERLRELRQIFLGEKKTEQDYWDSYETLDCYDRTFAQRIGWKWDFALSEIKKSGWEPMPRSIVCDLACGTGIAGRSFLHAFCENSIQSIHYSDRSTSAQKYSEDRHIESFNDISLSAEFPGREALFLISHIGTEIAGSEVEKIISLLKAKAYGFIWVEPGAFNTGRMLSQIREKLLDEFAPWAPCPSNASCPILSSSHWDDWCHQFAKPPSGIFQDAFWAQFSKELKVDLRSLPVSFLCMDRRSAVRRIDIGRFLGRPHINKYQVEIQTCTGGCLKRLNILKRNHPELYKAFRKDNFESLSKIIEEGGEIKQCSDPHPK